MKKIEESLIKSEHKVKAYVCYVSSIYARSKKTECVYSRLYDGEVCIDEKLGFYSKCDQPSAVFEHLGVVAKKCDGLDLLTIRSMKPHVVFNLRVAVNGDLNERYSDKANDFIKRTNGMEVIVENINCYSANKIDYDVEAEAKKAEAKIPTESEFFDYCVSKNWTEDGLKEELYGILCDKGWKTKKGKIANDWRILAGAYNSTLRYGKDAKYGKVVRRQVQKVEARKEKNLSDYICYTDGSCDNMSHHKAGGSAYIVVNTSTGEIEKVKTYHRLHTTNNRMEMLAIVSAVNACPKGSTIEIRTDSMCSIKMFQNTKWIIRQGIKNPDLIQKYRDCAKGKKVVLTWVKGHNGDDLNEQADCLAFGAYEKALKENGLPLAPERFRKTRMARQTIFETA